MANEQEKVKVLPHNAEAEQAVLGCIFINSDARAELSGIEAEDFYSEAHKTIINAMKTLYADNKAIDFVTVCDLLEKEGKTDSVGGVDYIAYLTNSFPTSANFRFYLDIVKRDGILRKLIKSGQKIIEFSFNSGSGSDALNFAEKEVFSIAQNESDSSLTHIDPALKTVIDKFNMLSKDINAFKGLATGYEDFDYITNGLQKSDLILLAARPGVGKTSFALNIALNAAIKSKARVAIFSLEMPASQLAQRALCSYACVSMEKALKGKMTDEEWRAILEADKALKESNIYIDDSSLNTPMDILSKCRKLKREGGLDFVMIDYLQLMTSSGKHKDNRQLEVSEITRSLKIAARELNVPVILLSQLSRAVETRQGHIPVLSDLRESGAIEQDADIVLFIYNPDMYNDVVSEDGPGICDLIIAKHRNGPLGTVKLKWIGEYTKFVTYKKNSAQINPAD